MGLTVEELGWDVVGAVPGGCLGRGCGAGVNGCVGVSESGEGGRGGCCANDPLFWKLLEIVSIGE